MMRKVITLCVLMLGLSVFSQNELFSNPKYRMSGEVKEKQILIWTENKKYYIGDKVSIIVESNFDVGSYYDSLVTKLKKSINHKYIKITGSNVYQNGKEWHSLLFTFKASCSKKIKIKPFKVMFEGREITSNSLKFKIKK